MISVTDLTLERYFEPVFRPVSFTLEAGKLLLITGANGCGKTTLIRMLAGALTPSQGRIEMQAENRVYVGHMLGIKDDLSVIENIEFMRRFIGTTQESTADIVKRVGLRRVAQQPARTLSAGQRKRCALSRLLLSECELWLLDEPYSNLDVEGMELVDRLLLRHLENGGACVLATHGAHRPDWENTIDFRLISGAAA